MKKNILYILLIIYCLPVCAQNRRIDSLKTVLKTAKNDTNKVKTLNHLSYALYKAGKHDSSMACAKSASTLAQSQNFKSGLAKAIHLQGANNEEKDNLAEALKDYSQALEIYDAANNKPEIAKENACVGGVYWNLGIFPKGLECYFKALGINKALGNKHGIASNLLDIGDIYEDEGNHAQSKEYYLKSLAIYKQLGDKSGIAGNLCNIGNVYSDEGNDAKALPYYYLSLTIEEKLGDQRSIARNYGNMGDIYEDMGNYTQALQFEFKALNIDTKVGYKKGTSSKMNTIGSIYIRQKKYKLAKLYIDSSLHVAQRIGVKEYVTTAYAELVELEKAMDNYKTALQDYEKYFAYNDSLVNDANTRKTMQAAIGFQFRQKQAIEKAERDKKDALAAQENKKQRIIRDAFMAGFALVLALAFLIFRGYRQKQKANSVITLQKELVEEKQKEIMGSIHYAERIQKALLASDNVLVPNLKGGAESIASDYFILYKPKDIVSGDFYWATKKDKTFYMAACDSTGHGVPGAFMSLLNISYLNEAVNEKNIATPDKVFNHVRKRLIENISQDGRQDGMDGVLVSFNADNENTIMQYATAYNRPIVIRNNQLMELAGDRIPVGKSPRDAESFTLHTVNLQKGDMLYLFTDGYADQFGGEKGKKFKYAQLLKLLLAVYTKTIAEQKAILETTFEQWKSNLEQVDDICVIGIRV